MKQKVQEVPGYGAVLLAKSPLPGWEDAVTGTLYRVFVKVKALGPTQIWESQSGPKHARAYVFGECAVLLVWNGIMPETIESALVSWPPTIYDTDFCVHKFDFKRKYPVYKSSIQARIIVRYVIFMLLIVIPFTLSIGISVGSLVGRDYGEMAALVAFIAGVFLGVFYVKLSVIMENKVSIRYRKMRGE